MNIFFNLRLKHNLIDIPTMYKEIDKLLKKREYGKLEKLLNRFNKELCDKIKLKIVGGLSNDLLYIRISKAMTTDKSKEEILEEMENDIDDLFKILQSPSTKVSAISGVFNPSFIPDNDIPFNKHQFTVD